MKRVIIGVIVGSSLLLGGINAAQAWTPAAWGHYCTPHGTGLFPND